MADAEAVGDNVPDKLFFRIGEVGEIVGVEPHVLRYWESEFKMRPSRSPSGQRMYKRKDIVRFLRIRKLLHDEGFTIAGARKALSEGNTAAEAVAAPDSSKVGEASGRLDELRQRIADARARFATRGAGDPEISAHAPERNY